MNFSLIVMIFKIYECINASICVSAICVISFFSPLIIVTIQFID